MKGLLTCLKYFIFEVHYITERIESLRSLGSGRFGQVVLARIENTDTQMAIKIWWDNNKEGIKNEVQAASSLVHPNIVRFYGVLNYIEDKQLMIFEYMSGGNLNDYLYEHNPLYKHESDPDLSLSEQLSMSLQLAEAVEYIHSRDYIHCDIDARNCQVASGMVAKLTGFELARDVYGTTFHQVCLH